MITEWESSGSIHFIFESGLESLSCTSEMGYGFYSSLGRMEKWGKGLLFGLFYYSCSYSEVKMKPGSPSILTDKWQLEEPAVSLPEHPIRLREAQPHLPSQLFSSSPQLTPAAPWSCCCLSWGFSSVASGTPTSNFSSLLQTRNGKWEGIDAPYPWAKVL